MREGISSHVRSSSLRAREQGYAEVEKKPNVKSIDQYIEDIKFVKD